jgi:site-specific DNA-methyltransferase (adenine-specific)
MRCIEEICVFYRHQPTYNPQGIIVLDKPIKNHVSKIAEHKDCIYHTDSLSKETETYITHYPRQVLEFKSSAKGCTRRRSRLPYLNI